MSVEASARERVIVALDVPDLKAANEFLDRLEGQPSFYKVGLELFLAEGARAIEAVLKRKGKVFLDLKLHDIPETVARAVSSAMALGATFLTIHTAGGLAMMKRAQQAAQKHVGLLGVTVLTSLAEDDLRADGMEGSMLEAVIRRANLAEKAGIAGVVCSPQEVSEVHRACPSLLLMVPGIRPAGAEVGDQKRVATPASAIADGASFLVVGRPVRDAKNPAAAFAAVVDEVASVLAGK